MTQFLLIIAGIALTALSWGSYGPVLHEGQAQLNDKIKPLICVGLAYLVVAVIIPSAILVSQGKFAEGWSFGGFTWSFAAGTAGTFGAFGIILALTSGGKPWYVMPLVFGFAPVVTTFISLFTKNLWSQAHPIFYAGLILVVAGAVTVLMFAPKAPAHGAPASPEVTKKTESAHQPSAEPEAESETADK